MHCRFALFFFWVPTALALSCPFSNDLFDNATQIYEQRLGFDSLLWESYNIDPSDPAGIFLAEFGAASSSVEDIRKADILIDYQTLIREALVPKDGTCDAIDLSGFPDTVEKYTECVPGEQRCSSREVNCDSHEKWMQYDGSCNNLSNGKWGALNTPYSHLLTATYDDGINSIRKQSKSNEEMSSPRIIGNTIGSANRANSNKPLNHVSAEVIQNVFAVEFGQAIAHDIGNRGLVKMKGGGANGIRCCSKSYDKAVPIDQRNSNCIPINVPRDDEFYGKRNIGCLNYIRVESTLASDCKMKGVPKINTVSAYLDMHIVYSNSDDQVKSMRKMSGGLFTMNANNILPEGRGGYAAGDVRVNQTPWLALIHSLLFRMHNYIAERLAAVNVHWDDDKLFNESRRINIATYEHLIYDEWLPTFMGPRDAEKNNLTCGRGDDACGAYDARVDASAIDEFSQATFRTYHTYVPAYVNFIGDDGTTLKTMELSDTIGQSTLLEDDYDNVLRGMLRDPLELKHLGYSNQLRNMFAKNDCGIGIDLFSLDVMRERDFGVSPYIDFFAKCGYPAIKSWKELKGYFSETNLQLLMRIYPDVDDIDLVVGVLLEHKSFGRAGAIGACILGEQFYRLKTGNRFFHTFPTSPYPFEREQIAAINGVTFAKMICWITDLTKVPEKSLEIHGFDNPLIECNSFPDFDVTSFKETTDGDESNELYIIMG